mgnify:CR=1 FL=1
MTVWYALLAVAAVSVAVTFLVCAVLAHAAAMDRELRARMYDGARQQRSLTDVVDLDDYRPTERDLT